MNKIMNKFRSKKSKAVGAKKMALNTESSVNHIYDHELSKMLTSGNIPDPKTLCEAIHNFLTAGGDINCRDAITGESFFHVVCKSAHHYMDPTTIFVFYLLGIKIEMDFQDHYGDTVLHKVCLIPGAWRCIVALMRCNASPLIKNDLGFTPEELILHHKNPSWEENLFWLRKFSPGLLAAVTAKFPDVALVEKLLKSWCRTTKIIENNTSICIMSRIPNHRPDLVRCFEKYTNTNELALSLLSGKVHIFDEIMKLDELDCVDVNTKDPSYQYHYKHYPVAPRPLLVALWETEQYDIVKKFLTCKPDLSVKYSFESEDSSPPKPLFFHLVNPKLKPRNDDITALILGEVDIDVRDNNGGTVLSVAIFNDASHTVIKTILKSGVNIAARDNKGMTARDHCIDLGRLDYRELIDDFVRDLIKGQDVKTLESLVLQMYDGIPTDHIQINSPSTGHNKDQMSQILENVQTTQETIQRLFSLVEAGDLSNFSQLMTANLVNARDKTGRSFLHYAVQHNMSGQTQNVNKSNGYDRTVLEHEGSSTGLKTEHCENGQDFQIVKADQGALGIIHFLVKTYPVMASFKNNLGQTPLHYAHIYSANQEVFNILEETGDYNNVEDVLGLVPKDYDQNLCGQQTFEGRRKQITEMDLDIFLNESQFEKLMEIAVQFEFEEEEEIDNKEDKETSSKESRFCLDLTGDMSEIAPLIDPLLEYGGKYCFNHLLFDCLDAHSFGLARHLILKGFDPHISKQYDQCNPENPMCAMMECYHPVKTLKQRAEELGATDLITLIDEGLTKL